MVFGDAVSGHFVRRIRLTWSLWRGPSVGAPSWSRPCCKHGVFRDTPGKHHEMVTAELQRPIRLIRRPRAKQDPCSSIEMFEQASPVPWTSCLSSSLTRLRTRTW
ncbi:hypothetical protein VFPBJ_07333 [Purpureocillium lilacinum]|uniref:Uncharacterized protein n=1 Tax=Purpureocillium lilacinum TaxID=33203 RepID=A0A179GN59_PURLI|nr:hypothetical protein VFPBJ_07333 [Purpureocillium lilacinum]